jgi:hypothetical protein
VILGQAPDCDVTTWPDVANNALFVVMMLGIAFAVVLFFKVIR